MKSKKHGIRISANRVIITSFLVDALDVLLSLVVAVLSGSVVMISQVLEGLADLASSGFLIVGLSRSSRNADKTHPFGYGREIYFWTLVSALLMFGITASLSFYLGLQRFQHPKPIQSIGLAFGVLGITLLTNGYAFFISLRRLLKDRKILRVVEIFYRSSLVETKTTFILDLMGSLASLLGILALLVYALTGDYRFDGLGAMVIGIVLAIFSYFLILGIRDLMVGKSASLETEERIKEATKKIKEVSDVLDLKTMHIGSEKLLVNMEVNLESGITTREIERIIDKIKARVEKEVPSVKHIQVELETRES